MSEENLFHGIAVIIDDEINIAGSGIRAIQAQIEEQGCPVVAAAKIPDKTFLDRFRGASFFVVDWNMYGAALASTSGPEAAPVPEDLEKRNAAEVIEFLKELKKVRFAPVFLFTNQSPEHVANQLKNHQELYDANGSSHILVKSKAEVQEKGVFAILSKYLDETPSAYVLKCWEREYERAKNELFLDFYGKSVLWPLILWKTFEEDNVPPSMELGELIGRNLLSRMTPFDFNLAPFREALNTAEGNEESYRKMLLMVLEGGRFLSKNQLHSGSIAQGDVFREGKNYCINIRPECDCVARAGSNPDLIDLFLLKGRKLSEPKVAKAFDRERGIFKERDDEAVVFGINDGLTVIFKFKDLEIKRWCDIRENRIGRLLPPFVTRLLQRYSAYLQRPGLTRIPKEAVPPVEDKNEAAAGLETATQASISAEGDLVPLTPKVVVETETSNQPTAPQPELPAKDLTQSTNQTDSSAPTSGGIGKGDETKSS